MSRPRWLSGPRDVARTGRGGPVRLLASAAAAAALVLAPGLSAGAVAQAAPAVTPAIVPATPTAADLGPNVYEFNPTESESSIQSTLDAIADQQVPNQFGTQRYALLFDPGTYGSVADPLIFQVGYYEEVAGLGQNPSQVVINGSIDTFNQCQLQRHGQLLAVDLQPHHRRHRWFRLHGQHRVLGLVPGLAAAPGRHQRQRLADGLLRRLS